MSTTYTLPSLCKALNSRGHSLSPYALRSRLLTHAPDAFEQDEKTGRYSIPLEDETALQLLAHRLCGGQSAR